MPETHDHCQCDFCSGVDCGQDDPEAYAAEQEARQKDHDGQMRAAEREKVYERLKITCFTQTSWDNIEKAFESLRSKSGESKEQAALKEEHDVRGL